MIHQGEIHWVDLGDPRGSEPAHRPRRSVANISQLAMVDRTLLDGRIGKLSRRRLDEVLRGVYTLLRPVDSYN